jgi:predicted MFS family arabinose efflux permease
MIRRLADGGRNVNVALLARVFMSAARAMAGVAVPVYLATIGWSASRLGLLFAVVAVSSAAISASVGFLSDRMGRRFFMIAVPLLTAMAAAAYTVSISPLVVFGGAALGAFGRGGGAGGGNVGPYQPAEQALVTASARPSQRTEVFGRLAFGSSLGALIGGLAVGAFAIGKPTAASALLAYRPVYTAIAALAAAAGLLGLLLIEPDRSPGERRQRQPFFPRRSARLLYRLWVTNSVNGAAMGMFGPFLTYWFFTRYGASVASIGALFAAVNAVSMVSNLSAASVARRFGLVRATAALRGIVAVLIVPMVLAPTFPIAGAVYLVRMIANRIAMPMRQSYTMGMAAPEERAQVAALSSIPAQATSAATPALAGELFEHVSLSAPFLGAGILQMANAVLYYTFFRNLTPDEERGAPEPAVPPAPAVASEP